MDAIAQWAEVDNQTPPAPSSAAVNGAALVLTFDGGLEGDPEQVPAEDRLQGLAQHAREPTATVGLIVTNPVAVSGTQVTLPLAEAVLSTDTVTVHYERPHHGCEGARLRDDDKRELPVKSFRRYWP